MYNFEHSNDLEQPKELSANSKINSKLNTKQNVHSFEEAVNLVGIGKFHYFLLLVCGICYMTVMVEVLGISVIMPSLKCDLKPTIAEQNMLTSAGFLGNILSFYPTGFFTDTWGRVKMLRTMSIGVFITSSISAFSVNIWMLIVFRFLNGLCIVGCQTIVFSFLGEFHGSKTQVRHVTLLSMFLALGLTVSPALATGILPLHIDVTMFNLKFTPWRIFILINSSLSVLVYCGLSILPESPKFSLTQGKNDEALITLRRIFKLNTGRPEGEYPVEQVSIEISGTNFSGSHGLKDVINMIWSQTAPLFYKKRALCTINIWCMMFFAYAIMDGIFMLLPTILDQIVATSGKGYVVCESMHMLGVFSKNATALAETCAGPVDTEMFKILMAIGATFVIIDITLAFALKWIGKKNLIKFLLFVSAAGCLSIHWASSYTLSMILLTFVLFVGNCRSILNTISVDFFPTNISAMAICLTMLIGRLGILTGQNVVGFLIFNYCDTIFYVFVGINIFSAILSLFLPDGGREKKPVDTIEDGIPGFIGKQSEEIF